VDRISSPPHEASQTNSTSGRQSVNRRGFLAAAGATAGGCLSLTGCVPIGFGDHPELVWGRRGFSEGRFLKPRAITIDSEDQLYIVDTTGRIQVFDVDGNLLRWWKTPQTENGRPTGLAVRPDPVVPSEPRLLVADTHYYRMLSYTPDGVLNEDEQIGGTAGHAPGEFAFVTDAVCDDQGCFYIGEYGDSDRIQKFDPDGNFLTEWGGTGRQPGQFVRPQSLAVRDQVLWVVDACNHRIQRYDLREPTPKLIDIWGSQGERKGEFFYPYDLAIASDGTVLVIEYKNQRIQRFDPEGKWIASWGGPGFDPGQLNQPWGLVVDSRDRIHVLDSNNHRVQRIRMPS
jgi:sugar lactone lactonase YvrE